MKTVEQERWQKIKLIVSDLDGTLLRCHEELSERTKKAYQAAQSAGIHVTFASGRAYPMLRDYARRLELNTPVITANGALLVDAVTDKVVEGTTLTVEQVKPALMKMLEYGYPFCVWAEQGAFYSEDMSYIGADYLAYAKKAGYPMYTFQVEGAALPEILQQDLSVIKALCLCDEQVLRSNLEQWRKEQPVLEFVTSGPGFLEVMCKGVTKGSGVEKLCKILNVKSEEVCVFGDYDNDLPMFAYSGIAVAMENAAPHIHSAADYVCLTNAEDGVADTIERFILRQHRTI